MDFYWFHKKQPSFNVGVILFLGRLSKNAKVSFTEGLSGLNSNHCLM